MMALLPRFRLIGPNQLLVTATKCGGNWDDDDNGRQGSAFCQQYRCIVDEYMYNYTQYEKVPQAKLDSSDLDQSRVLCYAIAVSAVVLPYSDLSLLFNFSYSFLALAPSLTCMRGMCIQQNAQTWQEFCTHTNLHKIHTYMEKCFGKAIPEISQHCRRRRIAYIRIPSSCMYLACFIHGIRIQNPKQIDTDRERENRRCSR